MMFGAGPGVASSAGAAGGAKGGASAMQSLAPMAVNMGQNVISGMQSAAKANPMPEPAKQIVNFGESVTPKFNFLGQSAKA